MTIKVPDLYQAAFALAINVPFAGVHMISPGRYAFEFSNEDGKADRALLDYANGKEINGRAFVGAILVLKDQLNLRK